MTDIEVETEIARLKNSEEVKLAKIEERIKNRRKQYMYCLRVYEKRGREMMQNGITLDNIEELYGSEADE